MYEWVMVAFTAVIAISTSIYTYYSHKLWKATRLASDIARFNTFMAYLTTLTNEAARVKDSNHELARLYEQLGILITEVGISKFIEDADLKKNPEARDFFNKLEGMLRGKGIDVNAIPWMRIISERMKD